MATISEAEAQVMEVLWAAPGPLAAEAIASALEGRQAWQLATVKTLLNRLLNKGAITASRDGRRYLYSPRLRREDWAAEQANGLIDRLFGGSLAPLVARFGSQRRLTPDEIEALRRLLQDHDAKPGKAP